MMFIKKVCLKLFFGIVLLSVWSGLCQAAPTDSTDRGLRINVTPVLSAPIYVNQIRRFPNIDLLPASPASLPMFFQNVYSHFGSLFNPCRNSTDTRRIQVTVENFTYGNIVGTVNQSGCLLTPYVTLSPDEATLYFNLWVFQESSSSAPHCTLQTVLPNMTVKAVVYCCATPPGC